ncbi:MAG: nucleotide-diphosphate-sugar epimerase/NmrA family protein [Nocardia sp.]|uniref:NmrA family NAD(P)-binding protein n=1 Tax=Nocardia sp. TaxID=1821 RepID=UPI0026314B09|nr:NAD(P)H-binding protein [Nocardia sp.]MCU1648364.1 nucleotide-diphosphate-sugar epimerase/NmrA family protein [Nocardia sp.]
MIIVTGATGTLGSQVVQQLLERIPADRVGVSVRDPARAADLAARGVRVRQGDFADPDSLASAFEGATQVLIVSSNETGGSAVAQHTAAIDAARAAGAARILYTSHQGAAADSLFAPMPDHAATERYLAESGTPCTSLRNGFYASTVPLLLGRALETGQLAAPADGPVSWTTHHDLAAATARILTEESRFDGPTPPLTAPDALDLEDIAGILTDLTGRPIHRIVVDDDEWAAGLIEHGIPASQATMLLGMFHASRNSEFATTGPTLGNLLTRTPTPLRALLAGLTTPN